MLRVLVLIVFILALIPVLAACIWEPDNCAAGPSIAVMSDAGGLDGALNTNCGGTLPPTAVQG